MTDCVKKLILASADPAYRDFTIKLTPSLDPETVVGVRTPRLREIAASLTPEQAEEFMKSMPHGLYEESNVHGYLIEKMKDYDACVSALDEFLPYVDNGQPAYIHAQSAEKISCANGCKSVRMDRRRQNLFCALRNKNADGVFSGRFVFAGVRR